MLFRIRAQCSGLGFRPLKTCGEDDILGLLVMVVHMDPYKKRIRPLRGAFTTSVSNPSSSLAKAIPGYRQRLVGAPIKTFRPLRRSSSMLP